MIYQLRAELKRSFSHRAAISVWGITLLGVVLLLGLNLGSLFEDDRAKALESFAANLAFPNSLLTAGIFGGAILYLMLPAVAAHIFGADYQADTWKMILPRASSRNLLITVKFLTVLIHLATLWLLIIVVVHLATLFFSFYLNTTPLEFAVKENIWKRDGAKLVADAVFNLWLITLACALTVVSRSILTAIVASFAIAAFTNLITTYGAPDLGFYLVQGHLNNLLPVFEEATVKTVGLNVEDATRPFDSPIWLSWLIVSLHLALNVAVSFIVFNRQDFDSK